MYPLWLLLLSTTATALPASGDILSSGSATTTNVLTTTHERRSAEPIAWRRDGRAAHHHVLPMRIGLKQQNLEHADRFVEDIADPDSPNYGKHWTAEEVANVFAPAKESTEKTIEWLVENGISADRLGHSVGRNWIEFDASIAEAEQLLNAKYHVFEHLQQGGYRIACDEYSIPDHLKPHIDFVMPTIQLDGLRPVAQARPARMVEAPASLTGLNGLKNCSTLTDILCLRALYNFGKATLSDSSNKLGIAEWADYLYYPDLDPFFANWTQPKIPAGTVPQFVSIDGGKTSNLTVARAQEVVESALDFQTAYSIIYPQQIIQYQNGDSVNVDSTGTFNIFLDALDGSYCSYKGGNQPYIDPAYPDPNEGGYTGPLQCGGAPRTNVVSISYGQIEAALPAFYQQRQCYEWMKLGLQGFTAVVSSGDSGVANRYNAGYNNSCVNPDGGYVDTYGSAFSPSFPVTCPYVTAVGATQLKSNNVTDGEEAVAEPDPQNHLLDYYSGGGFSNIFSTPSFQQSQVANYIKNYAPNYPATTYNRTGRGFPDVSANGLSLPVVYLNHTYGVGGTSASAPIFASLINLINEQRIKAGKKPVGLINPTIYKNPGMFNDITEGSNPGCGTKGFPAAKGWDPVTGMGTPNYGKMLKVFMALP